MLRGNDNSDSSYNLPHLDGEDATDVPTTWFAATLLDPPLVKDHLRVRLHHTPTPIEQPIRLTITGHTANESTKTTMRLAALLGTLCAATLAAAAPRTAHIYIQAVQDGGGKPHPLAEVSYDVSAPSAGASMLTYEAPDLPDGTSTVRVGAYDAASGTWASGTTVASADNLARGFAPHLLLSTDAAAGEVVSVALKGVRIDAGHTRDFGPRAVLLPEARGRQPALNKPVVLNPEGKREEPQEKTLLQKYWWVIAVVVFIAMSGGGEK
ncbi:hypothetical protein ISF_09279 [Cordyceps fumosorosea ARSEF 2679]|uniref:Cyclin-dependent protein kinase regulator pho80 n=1 Tax=Cordyceps fumosorosea (strain ARSEF 2679) TaxID=1081104 RepID=A0A162I496_CORFA|nr:hypothetical protein ISF_09279 [Cordyceps fumosorosea ARSEF 2679]OAA52115.1 hypothetical protein ISF_09279 [Cordyceps fumosorosea ARSEF 2679]